MSSASIGVSIPKLSLYGALLGFVLSTAYSVVVIALFFIVPFVSRFAQQPNPIDPGQIVSGASSIFLVGAFIAAIVGIAPAVVLGLITGATISIASKFIRLRSTNGGMLLGAGVSAILLILLVIAAGFVSIPTFNSAREGFWPVVILIVPGVIYVGASMWMGLKAAERQMFEESRSVRC